MHELARAFNAIGSSGFIVGGTEYVDSCSPGASALSEALHNARPARSLLEVNGRPVTGQQPGSL